VFRSADAKQASPSVEASRSGKLRTIHGAPPSVLVDSLFAAETTRQPDGTDVVNTVRIRVTADQWRNLPPHMDRILMDVIREHWPVKDGAGE